MSLNSIQRTPVVVNILATQLLLITYNKVVVVVVVVDLVVVIVVVLVMVVVVAVSQGLALERASNGDGWERWWWVEENQAQISQ